MAAWPPRSQETWSGETTNLESSDTKCLSAAQEGREGESGADAQGVGDHVADFKAAAGDEALGELERHTKGDGRGPDERQRPGR